MKLSSSGLVYDWNDVFADTTQDRFYCNLITPILPLWLAWIFTTRYLFGLD